ncbi:unnamed protein product [Amoebophrya sp. A120]|nr:unnamed protein product [Amoebophrya sp. A120]|eukprot:GSA120T00005253001.1
MQMPTPTPGPAGGSQQAGGSSSSTLPSLSRCETVDLARLQQLQRVAIFDLLDEFSGRKILALDESLIRALDLIVEVQDLVEHGAEVRKLSPDPIVSDAPQMIFLVRSLSFQLAEWIAAQIQRDEQSHQMRGVAERTYVLAFVPRLSHTSVQILQEKNVYESIHFLRELPQLSMFAIDDDLLSMEMADIFGDYHLAQDPSSLYEVALALHQWETSFFPQGFKPKISSVGRAAKYVTDVLCSGRLSAGSGGSSKNAAGGAAHDINQSPEGAAGSGGCGYLKPPEPSQLGIPTVIDFSSRTSLNKRRQQAGAALSELKGNNNSIDQIVLIDRKTDLTSLLCSQFTYEALIDQEFGISTTKTQLPSNVVGTEVGVGGPNSTRAVRLGNDDPLFRDVRYCHVSQLGPLLHKRTLKMQEIEAEKDSIQTVQDMQGFMVKLKALTLEKPLLSAHVNLAAFLNESKGQPDFQREWKLEDAITSCSDTSGRALTGIEEGMDSGWPLRTVLRLLCLYCEVYQGLPSTNSFEQLKRGILQVYGYEVLPLLQNLEATGLLTGPRKNATDHKRNWSQIKKDFSLVVDDQNGEADAFSYAYSGYAPLSVRLIQKLGWRGSISDSMALLAGPVCEAERLPKKTKDKEQKQKTIFVFFIGGVTYGEIAALRKLSEMEKGERKFLIGATSFTSPEKLFRSLEPAALHQNLVPALPQDQVDKSRGQRTASEERGGSGVLGALPGRSWFGLG